MLNNLRLIKLVPYILCIFSLCLMSSSNTYLLFHSKSEQPQYIFSELINKETNPSLFVAYPLDNGFYLASGLIPISKYIEGNLRLPEISEEKQDIILNGKATFIITRDEELNSPLYSLVCSKDYYFEKEIKTYRLYQLLQ